ncbi:unannotated protein [freshwater metagenome]|uniref:Unannotated protein n=1 Tax=freshwater metagenome TaxID=449393 RepID=A0A6J7DB80_9ZZZZ
MIDSSTAATEPDFLTQAEKDFAVFRGDGTALTEDELVRVMKVGDARFGLDPNTVRAARRLPENDVFVVLGRGIVCVLNVEKRRVGTAAGCTSLESASNGDTPMVGYDGLMDGSTRVTGLFPDGIDGVTIETEAGMTSAPVVNSILSLVTFDRVRSLSWRTADGLQHSLRAPADG